MMPGLVRWSSTSAARSTEEGGQPAGPQGVDGSDDRGGSILAGREAQGDAGAAVRASGPIDKQSDAAQGGDCGNGLCRGETGFGDAGAAAGFIDEFHHGGRPVEDQHGILVAVGKGGDRRMGQRGGQGQNAEAGAPEHPPMTHGNAILYNKFDKPVAPADQRTRRVPTGTLL